MDNSTKQRLLTICAELDAKSLPISVGLVKAKAKQAIPLPNIVSVINAFKGGERADTIDTLLPQQTAEHSKEDVKPITIDDLARQIAIQQTEIDSLRVQVSKLTQAFKKMSQ